MLAFTQLDLSFDTTIFICDVIMVPVAHAHAKHHKYFVFESCAQTTLVYWSKNTIGSLWLYLVKKFKIELSNIFLILAYFQTFSVYVINQGITIQGITIEFL